MDITDLQNKFDELSQEVEEKGSKLLYEALKPVFNEHVEIDSISWQQYTPYWNDGDAVSFAAHVSDVSLDSSNDVEFDYSVYRTVSEILEVVPHEIYLMLYGDHAEVTIHRDGTTDVDEFTEHD